MNVTQAVDELRRKRGRQRVTLDHVADHLVDFAERNPEAAAIVADFAEFLAGVEDVDHDHSTDEPGSDIASSG